jgi:NTE family protein
MKTDIFQLLKASEIFSGIDDASLKKLINKFETIKLSNDKILFKQGDISDSLYLLVSGRLFLILVKRNKENRIIAEIKPGETVGEVGAISNEPRTTTAKSFGESILLKLSSDDYLALCKEFPSVPLQTLNTLSKRSRNLTQFLLAKEPEKKHIVIFPANVRTSNLKLFHENIYKHTQGNSEIAFLSDYDSEFCNEYDTEAKLKKLIAEFEAKHKKILYLPSSQETVLAKVCFVKIDMIYIMVDADADVKINDNIITAITNKQWTYKAKSELILLHEKNGRLPKRTSRWLKLADFGLHHHVCLNQDKDIQRLLRFMRGEAVGLVLGGGGMRSWAHVGAVKALLEADIPIDAICGASAGAFVAGYYALHRSYEDFQKELRSIADAAKKSTSFYSFTWPAISLFNGKAYTEEHVHAFGKARIENLWLPFFSVACDLSKNKAVMQRTGLLWKKIRSSTSVPGIFPPFVVRGKLYLDGGIVNNLPVDLMRKLSPSIGTIIAVELMHNSKEKEHYNFPPILPFWQTLFAKLGLTYKKYKFPSFMETFLTSLLVGASIKERENSLIADLLIAPDLSKYQLLKINRKEEQELIEIGYHETVKAIKKWQAQIQKKILSEAS